MYWWFGTFLAFSHVLGIIIPIDFHILQRAQPPTLVLWTVRFFFGTETALSATSEVVPFLPLIVVLSALNQDVNFTRGGVQKCGYPNSWRVYNGKAHENGLEWKIPSINGWFGGSPIVGNLHMSSWCLVSQPLVRGPWHGPSRSRRYDVFVAIKMDDAWRTECTPCLYKWCTGSGCRWPLGLETQGKWPKLDCALCEPWSRACSERLDTRHTWWPWSWCCTRQAGYLAKLGKRALSPTGQQVPRHLSLQKWQITMIFLLISWMMW